MSGYDYSGDRASAQAMLEEYGIAAVLRRERQTAGTPWNPGEAEIRDYPVTVILSDFSERIIDGTNIRYGDRNILAGCESLMTETGEPVVPTTDDKILLSGQEYRIANVKAVAPGGVAILYEIHARGAGA